MKKILLIAIIAFFMTNCAESIIIKFDAEVELTVVDEQGKPIEGTLVKFTTIIDKQKTDNSWEEMTDANGKLDFEIHYENKDSRYHRENPVEYSSMESYYMNDLTYEISITKDGYQDWNDEVVLKNGDNTSRTITLTQKPQ